MCCLVASCHRATPTARSPLPLSRPEKRSQLPAEAKTFADSCLRSSAALFALLALFLYYCCVSLSLPSPLPPTFTLLPYAEAVKIPLKPVRENAFTKKIKQPEKMKNIFNCLCKFEDKSIAVKCCIVLHRVVLCSVVRCSVVMCIAVHMKVS